MLRTIHITTLDWVQVNVVQLLPHYLGAAHQFSMAAFLPDLIIAVLLVRSFGKAQALEGGIGTMLLQVIEHLARRIGLEAADAFGQIGCLGHVVQMVF